VVRGQAGPDAWRLQLRGSRPGSRRLPGGYLTAIAAGVLGLIAVPYAEELWRCVAAARDTGQTAASTAHSRASAAV
jgi:hypothetical protein